MYMLSIVSMIGRTASYADAKEQMKWMAALKV